MGTAYARVLGSLEPRVGLLNMASEAGKGNELARAAFPLLTEVPGFVGNVEPAAVLGGAVDVVVTDGFTGNVFLKTVETLRPDPWERARSWSEAAAGVLLGVAGEVLVAHGGAGARDISAALRAAARAVRAGLSAAVASLLRAGSSVGIA
jgi:phosphate acyltransferase